MVARGKEMVKEIASFFNSRLYFLLPFTCVFVYVLIFKIIWIKWFFFVKSVKLNSMKSYNDEVNKIKLCKYLKIMDKSKETTLENGEDR